MSENIVVIYERGILRPLKPLRLPESVQLEVRIVTMGPAAHTAKEMARQALLRTGIIRANPSSAPAMVSESELAAAANRLGKAGSLSELILAEREEQ